MSSDGARSADAADPTPSTSDAAGRTAAAVIEEPSPGDDRSGGGSFWSLGRVLILVAVAAVLVAGFRTVVAQAFVIPSPSMEPTLQVGDRVLVSRISYLGGDIQRGDVIVFDGEGVFDAPANHPRTALAAAGRAAASALGVPVGEHDYVKRVIGLPGDRVVCCDAAGRVTVNGVALHEPYLTGTRGGSVSFDIRVPRGRYWVMGDNRDDSGDSRAHLSDPGGGTVPEDHVVGRVVSVWWPWNRATGIGRAGTAARGPQEGAP